MFRVEASEIFEVDRSRLWDVYTDHESWKIWTLIPVSKLVEIGSDHKNGVGAVRKVGLPGIYAYEKVTLFNPCERMEYTVIKGGLPFKTHHGVVLFEEEEAGCRITWYCTFEAKMAFLAPMMKLITRFIYTSSLKGLKKHLASHSG